MKPINQQNFHLYLQKHIANAVITISPLRKQYKGSGGTKKCREYAYALDLEEFFNALHGDGFSRYLNVRTSELEDYVGIAFGSARKVLNIYFRSVAYSGYFQQKYLEGQDLISHESILNKLEIPVDSYVGKELRRYNQLPITKWEGVKNITPELNQWYQQMAADEAKKRGIARCHLDMEFYSQSKL